MKTVRALIEMLHIPGNEGFMVHFEKREGMGLASDHFPEKHCGETLICCEERAWRFAERFAKEAPENYVNIYVVDANFSPVKGYELRRMRKH